MTHRFTVGGHKGYITVGLYEDGRPGELFLAVSKEGSTVRGLLDSLGVSVSLGLQYGVPLAVYIERFQLSRFEPAGWSSHPELGYAHSLVDYVFRWLELRFGPAPDEADSATAVHSWSEGDTCRRCGGVLSVSRNTCPDCGVAL